MTPCADQTERGPRGKNTAGTNVESSSESLVHNMAVWSVRNGRWNIRHTNQNPGNRRSVCPGAPCLFRSHGTPRPPHNRQSGGACCTGRVSCGPCCRAGHTTATVQVNRSWF